MTDFDLVPGGIHRGLGVIARWPGIVLVIPSDAVHDQAVDRMISDLGHDPAPAAVAEAINGLIHTDGILRSAGFLIDDGSGPIAMAHGPVEILADGEVVTDGRNGPDERQVPPGATRLTIRAANLSKAAEPVEPFDLRRGVVPGAGITLAGIRNLARNERAAPPGPSVPARRPDEGPVGPNDLADPFRSPQPAGRAYGSHDQLPVAGSDGGPHGAPPLGGPQGGPPMGGPVGPPPGGGPHGAPPMVGPVGGPGNAPTVGPVGGPGNAPTVGPVGGPGNAPMGGIHGAPPMVGPVGGPGNATSVVTPLSAPPPGPVGGPQTPPPPIDDRFDPMQGHPGPSHRGPDAPPYPDQMPPDGGTIVQGILCSRQHFNNPEAAYCMVCGISMVHVTHNLLPGPRPTLGYVVFDDGSTYGLDRGYVVGREPGDPGDPQVAALAIQDNNETLSRRHAEIRLVDWSVNVIDLGSTNGTFIWDNNYERWNQIPANHPMLLTPGDTVALGRRTFVFESVTRL